MSFNIHGRNLYANTATTLITIRNQRGDEVATIHGGAITRSRDDGRFTLAAKHPTATDDEHGAAYVAHFEGHGLVFQEMTSESVNFTCTILKAQYWPAGEEPLEGECPVCPSRHAFLPFTPRTQPWPADVYTLEVSYPNNS